MPIYDGGQNICGASIGVLCLESYFPKPPGHIKNPSSLPFPVLYEMINGVTVPTLLNNPTPELLEPFIKGAQRLEAEGVRAITGSCGFLALFQKELAAAVSVPVFASSLIQVPLAYHMTGANAPVGVLTADASALTPRHFEGVGAADIPVAVQGLEHTSEFAEVILGNSRTRMDTDLIEAEVLEAARRLKRQAPEIRSLVLECTDLPPYAARLQEELHLPVFDLTTLAHMAHSVATRSSYSGIMPWSP
ncbi:aspartate/glutamate racemase family protein [Ruegeria sp. Ofav3-42]|uniref:aspartate/glutamate racemase family protein n=1 Tax=Ruegeria sp. Ofav3-42 TaxID=2917759 RepID=UPI001EF60425|nr:aspartate/glutamate racemase family protein [Ruegeria sp. Ofav3-42]MCG7521404.1 aspartate/glutamate racemase family protein [Ruegeria sp. Ofav3-42]